ncbi:YheT family hydrolase [Robertkochia flava]|uniref:YheT family hydrolase n=1 Tax=Robertkochia flava TaxID=3447986 RepID=UPI001CCE9227|nr:alpha/beta fold hydrolase [Robertkochia marina]
MPVISSSYTPPFLFKSGHFSTIYSGVFRVVPNPGQTRERIELKDGDFIDVDWSFAKKKNHRLVILLHGLEGNAQRPYILGAAQAFLQSGTDVCAVNFRGCSGETNRLYRSYHSGVTEDLHHVIEHILANYQYSHIVINGFSLGGNVTLKYLGTQTDIPEEIKAGIAFSVPCSLYYSMKALHQAENYLYARRFKKHLIGKLREKQPYFPELIRDEDVQRIRVLRDFDEVYTAKAHGFKNGMDYYEKASSFRALEQIRVPTYILNAANDTFLGHGCYPEQEAQRNRALYLEIPKYGGHVGFYDNNNVYYNEHRAVRFMKEKTEGSRIS